MLKTETGFKVKYHEPLMPAWPNNWIIKFGKICLVSSWSLAQVVSVTRYNTVASGTRAPCAKECTFKGTSGTR